MHKVFNFQENKSHNLRKGIHLASRNMHIAHAYLVQDPTSGN